MLPPHVRWITNVRDHLHPKLTKAILQIVVRPRHFRLTRNGFQTLVTVQTQPELELVLRAQRMEIAAERAVAALVEEGVGGARHEGLMDQNVGKMVN